MRNVRCVCCGQVRRGDDSCAPVCLVVVGFCMYLYVCVGWEREPCAKQNRMLFLAQIDSYEMNNFNKITAKWKIYCCISEHVEFSKD